MSEPSSHPLHNLTQTDQIDQVVKDCVALVRQEVSKKKGLTGTIIKGGLKVIERIRPKILDDLFYGLLPNFVEQLTPLYDRFQQSTQETQEDFTAYLKRHTNEVSTALLAVTDRRAQMSKLSALVKIYRKMRPLAQDQINGAIPALAQLLARHGVK